MLSTLNYGYINGEPLDKAILVNTFPQQQQDSSSSVMIWHKQLKTERYYDVLNVNRGIFSVIKTACEGGRVYSTTVTRDVEERIWIGTAHGVS